ncbi:MAG: type II secretion system protein [Verrucomicrobia bacterium]|nr:type II secretion system protein [Verrucomicrobiota bacterium]
MKTPSPLSPHLRSAHRRRAFTLVELVCTLAIIAGLMTFAVWNYREQTIRQRGRSCGLSLQLLEDAKAKFRADFPGTAIPTDPDDANGLRRYFAGGRLPTCPSGGAYANLTSGAVCTCSLNMTARYSGVLAGTIAMDTRAEVRAARAAAAQDPDEGGDRAANGFHDVGYAPAATPTPTPAP